MNDEKFAFMYGITSTHVENTRSLPNQQVKIKDHLHTRGEYGQEEYNKYANKGSPPHTWRILSYDKKRHVADRITSTHVENTIF